MQNKTSVLEETAAKIRLHINNSKTKIMKVNTTINSAKEEELENITSFTYLGSIVNTSGGSEQDSPASSVARGGAGVAVAPPEHLRKKMAPT